MKKFIGCILFIFSLMFFSSNSFGEDLPLEIIGESFYYWDNKINYSAIVQNNGIKPIYVYEADLQLFNEWDTYVERVEVNTISPMFLAPGDFTFFYTQFEKGIDYIFSDDNGPTRYNLVIRDHRFDKNLSTENFQCHCEASILQFNEWGWGKRSYAEVVIHNETEKLLFVDQIALSFFDVDGNLLDIHEYPGSFSGIPMFIYPESTISYQFPITSNFWDVENKKYKENNENIVISIPVRADAIILSKGETTITN